MSTASYLNELVEARDLACPKCSTAESLDLDLMANGPHYGRVTCLACGTFVAWAPKPTARPTKGDGRKTGLLNTIRDHLDGEPLYCYICLADERNMPAGTWMEAHHILEHHDGGTDHPTNLMPVCNDCHTLIHWRRRTTRKEPDHAPG